MSDRTRARRFAAGQVVTVFRSRRRAGIDEAYGRLADAMLAAARAVPGFVDFATFVGEDGEHVSLVTFATPEAHAAWRDDPRHRAAQRRGVTSSTSGTRSRWPRASGRRTGRARVGDRRRPVVVRSAAGGGIR